MREVFKTMAQRLAAGGRRILRARKFEAVRQRILIISQKCRLARTDGEKVFRKHIGALRIGEHYAAVLVDRIQILVSENERMDAARVKVRDHFFRPSEGRADQHDDARLPLYFRFVRIDLDGDALFSGNRVYPL